MLITPQEHSTYRSRWIETIQGILPLSIVDREGVDPEGDTFFCCGMFLYMGKPFYDWLKEFCNGRRLIFLTDDYMAGPATQIRNSVRGGELWWNHRSVPEEYLKRKAWAWADVRHYINWNSYSWTQESMQLTPVGTDCVFYWGMFREDRREAFERY